MNDDLLKAMENGFYIAVLIPLLSCLGIAWEEQDVLKIVLATTLVTSTLYVWFATNFIRRIK